MVVFNFRFTIRYNHSIVQNSIWNMFFISNTIKINNCNGTTQGKENKQEVVRLIAVSEKRQYEIFQGELSFHTQALMQQMQQMTEFIQQKQKRPSTTPTKTRKYCPSKRVNRTCTSPISIKYSSSDSESDGGTVESDPMLSD